MFQIGNIFKELMTGEKESDPKDWRNSLRRKIKKLERFRDSRHFKTLTLEQRESFIQDLRVKINKHNNIID